MDSYTNRTVTEPDDEVPALQFVDVVKAFGTGIWLATAWLGETLLDWTA